MVKCSNLGALLVNIFIKRLMPIAQIFVTLRYGLPDSIESAVFVVRENFTSERWNDAAAAAQ